MIHFYSFWWYFVEDSISPNTDREADRLQIQSKNVFRNKFSDIFWNSFLQNRRVLQQSESHRDCHSEQHRVLYVCDSPLPSYLHRGVSRQVKKLRHKAQPRDLLQEKPESLRENVKIENFRIQTLWSRAEGFRQRFSLFLQRAFSAIFPPVGHR